MERKRQEMLENARWRDEQRAANVKKYKEQADNENKESSKSKSGADFIKYVHRFNQRTMQHLITTYLLLYYKTSVNRSHAHFVSICNGYCYS